MKNLLATLWNDDRGALLAMEYLFVATILVIGIVVGLVNVREAINVELTELGNAILALSQGYTISGQSGSGSQTDPTCVDPSTEPKSSTTAGSGG